VQKTWHPQNNSSIASEMVLFFLLEDLPSMKLTAKAPENGWLEYEFPFGAWPIFRGLKLLVSGSGFCVVL